MKKKEMGPRTAWDLGAKASSVLTLHFTSSDMQEVMDALEVA